MLASNLQNFHSLVEKKAIEYTTAAHLHLTYDVSQNYGIFEKQDQAHLGPPFWVIGKTFPLGPNEKWEFEERGVEVLRA